MIDTVVYRASAFIATAGALCSLILGQELEVVSDAGVPAWVPALAGPVLMGLAWLWRRDG